MNGTPKGERGRMEGFTDPYDWLLALSGVGGLWVLLLFAYRKIPPAPTPDSIQQLRTEFLGLVEAFEDFVDRHDETVGRSHAKVGSLRRKLRKLQEEEGLGPDDVEEEESSPQATLAFPSHPPTREAIKAQARQRLRERTG